MQNFYRKNYLETCSKHVWLLLGTFFGHFENESFPVFWSYSTCRPSRVHWAFLFPKTYLKTSWKLIWTILGTFLDTFEIPKLFRFFFEFFPSFDLQGALGKKRMGEKITSKQIWTLLETFFGILKIWIFFHFLKFFEFSTLQGALGEVFYRKKHLEACWKHVWTLLGTYLGILKKFSSFLKFFPVWTFQGALGNFFWEDYLKTSSKLAWTLLRTFWTLLRNQFFLSIFLRIFTKFDLQVALGKKSSKKISSKQIWTLLEMFFGILKKWEFFRFLEFFSTSRPSRVHWAKFFTGKNTSKHVENMFEHFWERIWAFWKNESFQVFWIFFPVWTFQGALGNFFWEDYLKTSSKLVWTLLRTFWTLLRNQIFFRFFFEFSQNSISRLHWARKFRKKLPQASLDTFGKVFRDFGTLKSFRFLWIFFESPVCTGHSVFRRKTQSKHSQTMFLGTFSDNFESFEVFPFFKVFSKPRPSKVHWRLFFETKLPQNRFRTCLDNIRDSFGHFRNIEFFHFFQSFPYSTPQGALCKIFTQKITSKRVQNMFDCFWERFLGILKNWRFFQFFGVFPSFDSPGCTGQFFPKKSPQNKFKTCLDTFRKVFGHFRVFKFFRFFFRIFPSFDPRGCTGQFVFTEKTTSNHVQNVFELFGERFWAFWKKMNVFPFFWRFSMFRPSRVGALGNISFQKNTSKQVQHLFGNF